MTLLTILAAPLLLLSLHAAAAVPEQAMTLDARGAKIEGTLTLPASAGKLPVALIIAGSGPTDRDGNNPAMKNDSLRLLAQALGEAGIATLRFDKRGIAASAAAAPREADLRFDTYVDDAVAWLARLRADPRFGKVSVIGHSEGALIGMLAARAAKADALVSLAGAAQPAAVVLRAQLAGKLPPALAADSERILRALEDGKTSADVPAPLLALYRPSVQPYMVSWLRHDPAAVAATLSMPVLIVQGDTDIQVAASHAHLLHKARPNARLVLVPGMNHVLKLVPQDMARQMASYGDPALPLAPLLAKEVAAFLISQE